MDKDVTCSASQAELFAGRQFCQCLPSEMVRLVSNEMAAILIEMSKHNSRNRSSRSRKPDAAATESPRLRNDDGRRSSVLRAVELELLYNPVDHAVVRGRIRLQALL